MVARQLSLFQGRGSSTFNMRILLIIGTLFLTACTGVMEKSLQTYEEAGPPRIQPAPLAERMVRVPELDGKRMTIAVYNFLDKTGQRKPADNIANLSSAVHRDLKFGSLKH